MKASHTPILVKQRQALTTEAGSSNDDTDQENTSAPITNEQHGIISGRTGEEPSAKLLGQDSGIVTDTKHQYQEPVDTKITMAVTPGIRPTAPPVEEIDTVIEDINELEDKVSSQVSLIQSRKVYFKEKKESERSKIIALFSNILDMLADKEAGLLSKLDENYNTVEETLDKLLIALDDMNDNIKTEAIVAAGVKAENSRFKDVTLADIQPLLYDFKASVDKWDEEIKELLRSDNILKIKVNDEVIDKINRLDYIRIPEKKNIFELKNNKSDVTGSNGEESVDKVETKSTSESNSECSTEEVERGIIDNAEEAEKDKLESGITEKSTLRFDSKIRQVPYELFRPPPTAPPLGETQMEPNPPPYWYAVSSAGREVSDQFRFPTQRSYSHDWVPTHPEVATCSNHPSDEMASVEGVHIGDRVLPHPEITTSNYTSNEMVFIHSFHIKSQHDTRAIKSAALIWNLDKICVADRANSKIKFFTPSGDIYTAMNLGNCEIYDMAFIEKFGDEHRYVVTVPKAKILIIISVSNEKPPQIVEKLDILRGYTSIAKGPIHSTFVGAAALPSSGEPRVDILNIQGQVIRSFKRVSAYTNFTYPKCVAVYKHVIVVADWKLNCVVILYDDGSAIPIYNGTTLFPLKEPNSLTMDHFGNIMIVDGKTGNIHVVDLQCRPLEIIKCPRGDSIPKLIAFDVNSCQLAAVRLSGDIAIYDFKGGYQTNSHNEMITSAVIGHEIPQQGMLPRTVANTAYIWPRQAYFGPSRNMTS